MAVTAQQRSGAKERFWYGSGCIVHGRTVLTAAHVVQGAERVSVRRADMTEYQVEVEPAFVGDADGWRLDGSTGPDLALLTITDQNWAIDLPRLAMARLDRDHKAGTVDRVSAVGYPLFSEKGAATATGGSPDTVRIQTPCPGEIVLSNREDGLLDVQVRISPPPREDIGTQVSQWAGMSGAPVIASGRLVGVVIEHAPRRGDSSVAMTPLTALEPDPGHPLWGCGVPDPRAWWERLGVQGLDDLVVMPAPEEAPYRATIREMGAALHARMPQLLGRNDELAAISAFATSTETYRLLVGDAFSGKSALVYEAVTAGLPEEVDGVCYFLSRRASDADSNRFLAAVVPQLARLCEMDPPIPDRDQFKALWERATKRATEVGRHLLLVVDGLDEDVHPSGTPSVAGLLPILVDGLAHVMVSSRPNRDLPGDVADSHPLKSIQATPVAPFEGSAELVELAKAEIDNLIESDDASVDALGLLTAAGGPLSIADLATLANNLAAPSMTQRRQIRRLVTNRAARSLEHIGSPAGPRYQFAHDSLREYAQSTEDLCDPEFRDRIHRWAGVWRGAGWPPAGESDGTPLYLLDSYPGTLAGDPHRSPPIPGDPDRLSALASDPGWVNAKIQAVGVDLALAALRQAAAADRANPTVSIMLASVRGQAHNLRDLPTGQPGYILCQLCLQAAELAQPTLADVIRSSMTADRQHPLAPLWTTRRASPWLLSEFGEHDAPVTALTSHPTGRIVTGGSDGQIHIWNPQAAATDVAYLGRHDGGILSLASMPNGLVVSSGADQRVRIWDRSRPAAPVELDASSALTSALLALPGGRLASGDSDGRVTIWNLATSRSPVEQALRHEARVNALALLGDDKVVSGGADGRILVWDLRATDMAPVELVAHDPPIMSLSTLPNDRAVVSGDEEGHVLLWDARRPGAAPLQLGAHPGAVHVTAVLHDGHVVSGGADGRLRLWNPDAPGGEPVELGWHERSILTLAVLNDGHIVSGGEDRRLRLWAVPAHQDIVGGRQPETAKASGSLVGWGARGSYQRERGHEDLSTPHQGRADDAMRAVALLPGGRIVSGDLDGNLWIWESHDRSIINPVRVDYEFGSILTLDLLANGSLLIADSFGELMTWEPDSTGIPVRVGRQEGPVHALAVQGSGLVVTAGDDERLRLWNPSAPGGGAKVLGRHKGLWVLAALARGGVVSGGADGWARVWEPHDTHRAPVKSARHVGGVWALAVLDDDRVVSGGADGCVRVWDPADPHADPVEIGHHGREVRTAVALSENRVATGGGDRRIRVWDIDARREIAQARCAVSALAASPLNSDADLLVASHGPGLSLWSTKGGLGQTRPSN